MTKEDIIKLAREAGFELPWSIKDQEKLERFATLVAEREREACAKVCGDFAGALDAATAIRARSQA